MVAAPGSERPEYYDFDLFAASEGSRAVDDLPLAEIAYTVFDTETTGLDPAQGDEIIQIGAVRIVNGKLLRGECYEQLVDPKRSIPEASIPIHGIRPEMVRGQPSIAEALPAFHAFASDTVLVGHNVAFDMCFLKLKEAVSRRTFRPAGARYPSFVEHRASKQSSHGLEAIATRLGVTVSGRHKAVGDALATAEVFLKLVPLLRQQGILTLRQARQVAQNLTTHGFDTRGGAPERTLRRRSRARQCASLDVQACSASAPIYLHRSKIQHSLRSGDPSGVTAIIQSALAAAGLSSSSSIRRISARSVSDVGRGR